MKPIKLVIEGINSFTDAQTLDFEAVGRNNLFCISGKTGAGKSTIFDSLMLALYGKSSKGNLADVVNLSRTKARVVLDFCSGSDMYTVERTISCRREKDSEGKYTDRRKAVTDCVLHKNGEPIAKGADETNAVIAEIIGLDASEFKNVYLLEQGEYADFLKKPPAEQTKAVGKIFSLMRFDEVYKLAVSKRDEQERLTQATDKAIEALGEASPEMLKERKSALSALKSKITAGKKLEESVFAELEELQKIRDKFNDVRAKQLNVKNLMLQSDEYKKKLYVAETELKDFEDSADKTLAPRLEETNKRLNELTALALRDEQCKKAEAEAAAKRAAYDKACAEKIEVLSDMQSAVNRKAEDEKAFANSIADLTAVVSDENKSETLSRIKDGLTENSDIIFLSEAERDISDELDKFNALTDELNKKRDRVEAAKADCAKKLGIIDLYVKESEKADREKSAAAENQAQKQKALDKARLNSHAAAVAAELHDGDVCPVCGGQYHGTHEIADGNVAACKTEFDRAVERYKKAESNAAECTRRLDRAKSDYGYAEEQKTKAQAELSALTEKVQSSKVDKAQYEKIIKLLTVAKSARMKLDRSQKAADGFAPALSAVQAKADAAKAAFEEAEQKAEEYKAALGEYYGKTQQYIAGVKTEKTALEAEIKKTEDKRKTLSDNVQSLKSAVGTIEKSLEVARADCPVDIPDFDEQAYTDKKARYEAIRIANAEAERDIAVKETEIRSLTEKCDTLSKIQAERKEHVNMHALYKEIATVTRGKAMLNYVAAEYIDDFTAIASDILGELSGGKYSMSYDKLSGFTVADFLNDGKSRKTDTLSGGELFLASLSVAIAIARTQSRGNNAFFFLDEGFGTLDGELIDVVYAALESLSRDCLVGVVSHSDALIEKMPSCVKVLEATDTHGSRIEFQ